MDVVNGQLGSLIFLTGSMSGKTVQITKPMCTLGREPTNDIVLSDPSISRHHAQILWTNGSWTITKLAPQNTVSINKRDVQQGLLNDKDIIGLGGITLSGSGKWKQSSQSSRASIQQRTRRTATL